MIKKTLKKRGSVVVIFFKQWTPQNANNAMWLHSQDTSFMRLFSDALF